MNVNSRSVKMFGQMCDSHLEGSEISDDSRRRFICRICSLRILFERALSTDTVLHDDGCNLRILRPAPFNVACHRRRDVCSMTDSPSNPRVSIPLYLTPSGPFATLMCGANASTKGSQPVRRRDVWRIREKARLSEGKKEERRTNARKISRVRRSRAPFCARGDSSVRVRGGNSRRVFREACFAEET